MASIMEGPLSKWTNVMKGWQYRWFVLDYNAGLLSYYTVSAAREGHGAMSALVGRWETLGFSRGAVRPQPIKVQIGYCCSQ